MPTDVITETAADDRALESTVTAESTEADVLVEEELLVEEVSIDGMCGVY